jgi:hypothetical protein
MIIVPIVGLLVSRLTDTDRPVSYVQNGLYHTVNIPESAVEEKTMLSDNTKSTTVNAGRPATLQSARNATAARGLQANRGAPAADIRASSLTAKSSAPADRLGTVVTLLIGIALVAGGSLMVGQIWANLSMIR